MNRLCGAVLCGGRSSRFGTDKAFISVDGDPMALKAVTALRLAGADPIVAIAADQEQGGRLSAALSIPSVVDRWPGEGPLGGLLTALLWFRTGSILTLPCDLPLVTGPDLEPLVNQFLSGHTAAVVAETERGPNCTIGIWPAISGPQLKRRFDDGARRLDTVLQVADFATVPVESSRLTDADTADQLDVLLRWQKSDGGASGAG